MSTGIPTSNILQPGVINPGSNGTPLSIISGLQLLTPQYWKRYVERYGVEAYDYFFQWLATFGGMELVKNQNFFWYESRGKNQIAITNLTQVSAPGVGTTVTVDIPSSQVYDSTYSPLRVGETVYVASSNIEGEIIGVASDTQCTIRPKDSTLAFVSAGSVNLLANEVLIFGGLTDVGEASGSRDSQVHLDVRLDNNITPIREDYAATDFAEMSEVWYDTGVSGSALNGVNQSGTSFFTYKALVKTDRRFLNSIESKLMRGDQVTNTGLLNSPGTGCQGFIPSVIADGEPVNYTPGTLDLAKLHQITRIMDVNGCAKNNMWLQDIFQSQDFSDGIFKEYPAGAYVWGSKENSEEATVAYGTRQLLIDGFMFRVKKYSPFNTEVTTGLTPAVDYFRDFGIIAPMDGTTDAKTYTPLKNITVMYQQPQRGGTIGNGIRVWPYGGGSTNPTDGTLVDKITMATYRSIRTAARNQFVVLGANI